MEEANIICSIIIFFYLIIIFLIMYFKNKYLNKTQDKLINIKDINPTINFYCYDLFNGNKLIWITLLELINKKIYKLKLDQDELLISYNKKSVDVNKLDINNYQKDVVNYLNTYVSDKEISIKKLCYLVRTDCNFNNVLSIYMKNLKSDTKNTIGDIERMSNYKFSIVCTFLYCLQVVFFVAKEINLIGNLLISLPFTYLTISLSDLLKNKVNINDKRKYIIFYIVSLIFSLVMLSIWNTNINNNYLLFHFLMGFFTYSYPLLIMINIYLIKENYAYKNKLQNSIVSQINNLRKKDDKEVDYLYFKSLKIRTDKKENLIDKYFEILDL